MANPSSAPQGVFESSLSSDDSDEELMQQLDGLDAAYTQQVSAMLLSAYDLGIINLEPGRLPRRWQAKKRMTGLYEEMLQQWPSVGRLEEDQHYKEDFRVDKQTFDMMHDQIKVKATA